MAFSTEETQSIPLELLSKNTLDKYLNKQNEQVCNWVTQTGFDAESRTFCLIPNKNGSLFTVLVGIDESIEQGLDSCLWAIADLPKQLPAGDYHIGDNSELNWGVEDKNLAAIGWGLGHYSFNFFKKDFLDEKPKPLLRVKEDDLLVINAFVDGFTLVRDLVNTPANHMMPQDLSELSQELAQQHQASFDEIIGGDLLTEDLPAIHAVGRASAHDPRLLKLEWGSDEHPKLVLVGKGVCFDTGGLDLKPSKFMRNMKKDMGGAAHVLGLAHIIMGLNLPVHLQVLIPAVDNAVSGDAYRPGDIIDTRSKKTVEIDNTDAEGRVVLCDALTLACEQSPDLIIDFATLTGAARVAVGTEIPALFCNSNDLTQAFVRSSENTGEIVWPLPLHHDYRYQLNSDVADICNSSTSGYGGAITAALYLNEFIEEGIDWAHFDVMAWNTRDRPGRPKGGEAMGLMAVYDFLQQRYQ